MKSKMLVAILLGCLAWQQGALSQTDTAATDTNQSINPGTVNPPVVPAASTAPSSSATSSVAALTVVFPTSIATQPAGQTAVSGNNATFSVTAGGTPPLSYQWYFNGAAIEGATGANYTVTGVAATNAGDYTVVITNSCGTMTSSVAALTVVFPPSITAQPSGQTVINGGNATFSVAAEGTPPLNYQWYFNDKAIEGATGAEYTINGVTTNNEGNYMVVITNSCGSVTSSNITVDTSAPTPPAAAVSTTEAPAATTGETTGTATPPVAAAVSATEAPAATTGETTGTAAPPVAAAVSATEAPAATTSETAGAAVPPVAAAAIEAPAATTTSETTASTATPPVAAVVSTNESPDVTASNAMAAASAAVSTNGSSSATTSSNATAATSSSNPQPAGPASIPLIQFQDVPITTAIENLARQAGINYLIDPKIGYGQPDANGQIKPEPTLSIRWENITAEQALKALLNNYGLQLTEDRQTHIGRITIKDPMAPPPLSTRVIQLKYASTSNMVDSVQSSLTDKRSKVLPDSRTSQLIIVATDNEQEALAALINELDKPTRQVLIETKLVQISSNPKTTKGVDWSGTLAAQHVSFGNGTMSGNTTVNLPGIPSTGATTPSGGYTTGGTTPSSTVNTILNIAQGGSGMSWNTVSGFTPGIGFLTADGASAVLSFLNATYDAQITSTPRVVTLDNQMANIEVTRTYPIINMAGGTQNSSGSSSITYSNVGTILQVTPRISANDYIWMKVKPTVSSHYADIIVTVSGGNGNGNTSYPVPEFDVRTIDSQVMIPNGNTLVMGGLVSDNPSESYTKVPVLGDIPGLGWAFRSESKANTKDNLIIFLTPTIIKDSDFQPVSSVAADFLQSKPPVTKTGINPNTIWDGSEPRTDWSNPAPMPGEYDKK